MSAELLHGMSSFARGYLLASSWIAAPSGDAVSHVTAASSRVAPLAGSRIEDASAAFHALSPEEQSALRREWLLSEPERKLEPALDLHWSWLPSALEDEAPALLVLLLHSMPPESAKEALRAMWPRLRNVPSKELEGSPPSDAWLATLRRWFFSDFTVLSEAGTRPLAPLLHLGRRELHLFLQETGLEEIALAGGEELPPELAQRLEDFDGVDATRVRRLMKRAAAGDPARCAIARLHLDAGLTAAGPKGDLVGQVALDHAAMVLSGSERGEARFLAQRLGREQGEQLLASRDAWEAGERGEVTAEMRSTLGEELLRRIAVVVSRTAVPTVANRVWA